MVKWMSQEKEKRSQDLILSMIKRGQKESDALEFFYSEGKNRDRAFIEKTKKT